MLPDRLTGEETEGAVPLLYSYAAPSPFPPSFEGNPWAYGFGLFGDVVAAALAVAMLTAIVIEPRRNYQVSRMIHNQLAKTRGTPNWSPLRVYRMANISMLSFVVMRALPDALWMLAWGEVSEPTIRFMLAVDLWMDGVAVFPFFFSVMCWAWGRQIIPQRLLIGLDTGIYGRPPWNLIWRNGRIVIAVLVIAILVTIGKAHG